MSNRLKLTATEVAAAFDAARARRRFPPILTTLQVARLLGVKRKTVYFWVQQHRLDGTFRKRGKRHLFWRDRVVVAVFNGPEWSESNI
jgi:excisionase family DNA binding protein